MLNWDLFLQRHEEEYKAILTNLVDRQIRFKEIQYPPTYEILNALHLTPFKEVKCVILGQDPYHGEGQANGLAFSVKKGQKIPPSLKNIYKELKNDLGIDPPEHGDLTEWAKNGVLLLNTVLTVAKSKPGSHFDLGWEMITDKIIIELSKKRGIVFVLWGNKAQSKEGLIDKDHNLIIKSAHPSPFSANRGFFGSKPFSKINKYLAEQDKGEINWKIEQYTF